MPTRPLLAALVLSLVPVLARAEAPGPNLPPPIPDARPLVAPLLRPGQHGVTAPAATAVTVSWDLKLKKGDRVLLEASAPAAFTLQASPPLANGPTPGPALQATAEAAGGEAAGFRARLEVRSDRKGLWRIALRPEGGAPVPGDLAVRCLGGPSCKGAATGACGPDAHPWWLRTPARLLSDPARFEGHPVRIRARVRADLARCTARACPPGTCCNSCVAPLVTGPAGLRGLPGMGDAGLRLEGLTCRGTDCDYRQRCPFSPGSRITAWGYLHSDDTGTRLEVHGACGPLPKGP